ncbi:zinc finger protein 62 homolog [Aricia agestis]|uniref:zinc finger protein 62 homolog n=1 Tax=Aricia agestis TaxID=91739 RepID=UPI001C203747|nr:zinc finger protein 62 homolog [Aricia agestis]
MAYDTDTIKSAVKFISGESKICRLCIGNIGSKEISFLDFVTIDSAYYNDKLSYQSIFRELGVSSERALPEVLCVSCASLAVNSFLFQKLCEYSQQQWHTSLCSLDKMIAQSENLNARAVSAYFIVQENKSTMLTCYNTMQEKNKKTALTKLQKNMKIRLKSIKDKKRLRKKIPCPSCPKIFVKEYELEDHREKVHYPKNIKCDSCTKMFSTKKQLRRHKNLYHVKFTCIECSLELSSKHLLRLHMDKHYRNSCVRCNKKFESLKSYKVHMKSCGQREKFICDICSKAFAQKQGLTCHLKCLHGFGKNLLSCKWCGKKFDMKSRLSEHIVKHTRERNFTCEICGAKFVSNPSLVYHRRLHTGERPYPCDMCNEHFLSATTRLLHKHRVHLGPTKECNICQAKFITSFELKKHKKWHHNPHSKLYVPTLKQETEL